MKKSTKQKKKINYKKITPYLINILIATTIFILTLVINKIAPFGEYSLAKYDSAYQYQPMLYNFLTSIKEGLLSNYSFLNGLGTPTLFNYVYYLSSPINFLALPFKSADSMFFIVILIKIIITIITTTFYTLKRTNNKFISTIVSISYVFSSWFLAYHNTIMWLDAFMMFPLFQYGLEELISNNKYYIYIFTLSYIMISNFYIAFMICLYTLVYYIYNMIIKKDQLSNKLKNFNIIAISTIITFLLAFAYIYITYDSFMTIDIYINKGTYDNTTIPILNMIKAFFSGNKIVTLRPFGETFPNIALSTIFTTSLIYFFINKNISKKEKILTLLCFIFIIILFYSKTLNYIMNCFHVPIGFNFRYSFLISFFLIKLFIRNYQTFDKQIYKRIYLVNLLLIILLLIELIFNNIEIKVFILNIVSISILSLIIFFYNKSNIYKYIFTLLIILEVTSSSIINITSSLHMNTSSYSFNSKITNYREILDYSTDEHLTYNLNLYENKNTISYFSSMQYNQVLKDLLTLGCPTDQKAIVNTCINTQLFNTIFNIKTNNDFYLEKIYAVNKDVLTYSLNEETLLDNQALLLKGFTGNSNILNKIELKPTKNNNNHYKITKTGTYYFLLDNLYQIIKINNIVYTYDTSLVKDKTLIINEIKNTPMITLELEKNDIIEITFEKEELIPNTIPIYLFNKKEFTNSYNKLKENEIKYSKYSNNFIEGTINVDENQIIFTSIPYDNKWEITIDNKKIKPTIVLNSLMGIECEPGKHNIKLEYKTNYTVPLLISISTLISLLIKIILDKKNQKKDDL